MKQERKVVKLPKCLNFSKRRRDYILGFLLTQHLVQKWRKSENNRSVLTNEMKFWIQVLINNLHFWSDIQLSSSNHSLTKKIVKLLKFNESVVILEKVLTLFLPILIWNIILFNNTSKLGNIWVSFALGCLLWRFLTVLLSVWILLDTANAWSWLRPSRVGRRASWSISRPSLKAADKWPSPVSDNHSDSRSPSPEASKN